MKAFQARIVGAVLITTALLVAIFMQVFGRSLIWIDQNPFTPPAIAASGGVVTSATHYSFAIIPLALALLVGVACLFIRKRDETAVA